MVLVGQAIRSGLKFAARMDKKYNINKIFVEKYVPPHLRGPASRIIDLAGGAAPLIYIVDYLNQSQNALQKSQQQAPSSQYAKTRSGRTKYGRSRNRRSDKFNCSCRQPRKHRSYSSKYR